MKIKFFSTLAITSALLLKMNQIAYADNGPAFVGLSNPALQGTLGNNAAEASTGSTFLSYFITLWRALITVGALVVIVMFLWGAIEWISAGGDSAKVQKARDKMTQAIVGLIILVGSFVIIGFIGKLFFGDSFDILNLTIPTPTT